MEQLAPFTVAVPEEVLTDLRARLERTRFIDDFAADEWTYGVSLYLPAGAVRLLADDVRLAGAGSDPQLLRSAPDPRRRSAPPPHPCPFAEPGGPAAPARPRLARVDLRVRQGHRAAVGSGGARRRPERTRSTWSRPRYPGYGFSGPTTEPGWGPVRIAAAFAELMERLGYGRYGAAGGDWGAIITTALARADGGRRVRPPPRRCRSADRQRIPTSESLTDADQQGPGRTGRRTRPPGPSCTCAVNSTRPHTLRSR